MDLPELNETNSAILMIIIGILAVAFPMLSTATVGIITSIIVLLIAVGLVITGIMQLGVSRILGALSLILAILCLIFSYELAFDPAVVSALISIAIYLIGIILIIIGIFAMITGRFFQPFSAIGLSTIVFGIITIIIGVFLHDPVYLGIVIGIWLILSGLLTLFGDNDKNYIDI